jgi:hypothetical protein
MPDLTPDQSEAVRRALSDARATDPLPTDVAARLDHVLDGLHAERASATPAVASLEARRRRRNATRMLVAAAAVVVGGFGLDAMVGHDLIGGGSNGDSAGTAEIDRDGPAVPAQSGSDSGSKDGTDGNTTGAPGPTSSPLDSISGYIDAPLPLSDWRFAAMARRDAFELDHKSLQADTQRVLTLTASLAQALTVCLRPADGESAVLVTYDGRPAALRIRKPHGNEQLVDLYYCPTGHSGRLIRTIVLSAR